MALFGIDIPIPGTFTVPIIGTLDHTLNITNVGTNTHTQIDTFIGTTVPNTYLKLDASNDPITNTLQVNSRIDYGATTEYIGVEDFLA